MRILEKGVMRLLKRVSINKYHTSVILACSKHFSVFNDGGNLIDWGCRTERQMKRDSHKRTSSEDTTRSDIFYQVLYT